MIVMRQGSRFSFSSLRPTLRKLYLQASSTTSKTTIQTLDSLNVGWGLSLEA